MNCVEILSEWAKIIGVLTKGELTVNEEGVICCEYEADALKIRQSLGKRLEKFQLQLNEEKTKLVPFDRRAAAQGVKQGTFT